MAWVDATVTKTESIPIPRDRIWPLVSSLERLAEIFPGLESIRQFGPHTIWTLREQGAGGVTVTPTATTSLLFVEPSEIRIEDAHRREDNARVSGRIGFDDRGTSTEVTVDLELAIQLPIPFFAVPLARSIANRRIERSAVRLLENVQRSAS